MFSRVVTLLSIVVLFGMTFKVQAVPSRYLEQRQLGNLECNVDRIQIVSDLFSAASTARNLTSELASDPTASGLMQTVNQGITDAQDGVGAIAIALVQGQQAPAAARDQVKAGLQSAGNAFEQISSTDPTVNQNLNTLGRQLASAGAAGTGVLANCN